MAIMGHWWKKQVSLALGIATMGSAVSGVIMPIATCNLINIIGFSKIFFLAPTLIDQCFQQIVLNGQCESLGSSYSLL
jgi:hypothetical protein